MRSLGYKVVRERSAFGIQLGSRIVIHEIDEETALEVVGQLNCESEPSDCKPVNYVWRPSPRVIPFTLLAWLLIAGFLFVALKAPKILKIGVSEEVTQGGAR